MTVGDGTVISTSMMNTAEAAERISAFVTATTVPSIAISKVTNGVAVV